MWQILESVFIRGREAHSAAWSAKMHGYFYFNKIARDFSELG